MRISELRISGFKSLRDTAWSPSSLNVFIGPNASGKSNLLQVLQLLQAAALGELSQYVQRCGGIDILRWDGTADELAFSLVFDEGYQPGPRARYDLALRSAGVDGWSAYSIRRERLATTIPGGSDDVLYERTATGVSFVDDGQQNTIPLAEGINPEEALLSVLLPFSKPGGFEYKWEMERWAIYTGIETGPSSPVRQPSLTRRETVVSDTGDNLIAVLHTLYTEDRQFRTELNAAMRAAFEDEFEELIFPPASDQRVQLRVHWKGLKHAQPAALLSDGTLRFLYLLAILANPNPPPLIAIEEPEVGLHPSMLPIIAEYAAQAAQKCQVILTTHSADFLDAFKDTDVIPTTTVAHRREGETELRVLGESDLEYWLREYTLGQLFRSSELEQIG